MQLQPEQNGASVYTEPQWHTNKLSFCSSLQMLLQRSSGHEGTYVSVADGCYAYDIFLITWGPTIAALSYIYDHADDKTITKKAISGFRCTLGRWGRKGKWVGQVIWW